MTAVADILEEFRREISESFRIRKASVPACGVRTRKTKDVFGAVLPKGKSYERRIVRWEKGRDRKGKIIDVPVFEWRLGGKVVKDAETLERLNGMRLPPAWRTARAAKSEAAKVQAMGIDAKGRVQRRYSRAHMEAQAEKKFRRAREFSKEHDSFMAKSAKDARKGRPEARVLLLEDRTAIRVGSTADTLAERKAFGITTLRKGHVKVKGNTLYFDFTAKEGIRFRRSVRVDKGLADWVRGRVRKAKPGERLWPEVSAGKLNGYLKSLAGPKFSVKDFRNFAATKITEKHVQAQVAKMTRRELAELTKKRRREIVNEAAEKASEVLGNTPSMAKNSYIDPQVWNTIGGLP